MPVKGFLTMTDRRFLIGLSWMLLLLSACQGPDPIQPQPSADAGDFLPLETGRSWTWAVDSVVYDPVGSAQPVDTFYGWLREQVVDVFPSGGSQGFILHRSVRRDSTEPWTFPKAILVFPEEDRILWNEDNLTFVRLKDQLSEGLAWEGTALFDPLVQMPIYGELMQPFKGWSSEVLGLGDTLSVGADLWDDVLTVRHADSENLLERRFSTEAYQRGVGMVYRRMMILDTQCQGVPANCAGIPWELKAEKGYILQQRLISYE